MLTAFGSVAVTVMLLSYWLEARTKWSILVFAMGCAGTAAYSALAEVWPIVAVEAVWALVAIQRFLHRHRETSAIAQS